MHKAFLFVALWFSASTALAGPPEYSADPFGDRDFAESPLILDVAHPARGRGEMSLWFASSVIDKYTSHMGGLLQLDYQLSRSLGAGFSLGYLHGSLTRIVTDEAGIIGNNNVNCTKDPTQCEINPDVPDYAQITGMIDAFAVWAPLYGKINVVSELDVNLEAYLLGGVGVHGRRTVEAEREGPLADEYSLSGGGFAEGGFLSDPQVHGTLGFGLQIFLVDWLALRGEARGILYMDEFDFKQGGSDRYLAQYWLFQGGLGIILF